MSHSEQTPNKLCAQCKQFDGNPTLSNLCSACIKKFKNPIVNNVLVQAEPKVVVEEEGEVSSSLLIITPNTQSPSSIKESLSQGSDEKPAKLKQDDHRHCWSCNKKVNLLGIKCKCEYTFCNKHRLPENHSCEYDHVSFERELIRFNNPLVKKLKLSKI